MTNQCSDSSTKYLSQLGFNVIRYSSGDVTPLVVLARKKTYQITPEAAIVLGPLENVVKSSKVIPKITLDQDAPNVNGQKTDNIDIDAGFSLLGSFLKSFGGGELAAHEKYTKAKSIAFTYEGVKVDSVLALSLGEYLTGATINSENLMIGQYFQEKDKGELFAVNKTLKSNLFTVKFIDEHGNDTGVDVPLIKGVAGGKVAVTAKNANNSTIQFSGENKVAFGFQCLALQFDERGTVRKMMPANEVFTMTNQGTNIGSPELEHTKKTLFEAKYPEAADTPDAGSTILANSNLMVLETPRTRAANP